MNLEVLRIFLASPNDVDEERSRLEDVISELNSTWGDTLGLRLELVKWETHAYPGISSDPQAVINEQIGDNYDVFVGILWARFGTPTKRSGSGTEEEFRRALARFRQDPNQLRIMFYFKDSPISPTKLDAAQLGKVQAFRKELGELGSLCWPYDTTDEFVNLARVHLAKQAQGWGKSWGLEQEMTRQPTPVVGAGGATAQGDEELGYLDLMETVEDSFRKVTEAEERMGSAIDTLGQKAAQRTAEIEGGASLDASSKVRYYRKVTDALADDMDDFVERIRVETPIFAKLYRSGTSAMARAASILVEFGGNQEKELSEAVDQLRRLLPLIEGSRDKLQQFRSTLMTLPRASTRFIRSREGTVAALDALSGELDGAVEHTSSLLRTIEDLLSDKRG